MSFPALVPVYLRRKRKIVVTVGEGGLPLAYVATALKNLESLGYTCTPELAARLGTLSESQLAKTYRQIGSVLRKLRGADATWVPMYPNFPSQVMAASEAELYWNALVHYAGDWIGVRIMPVYEVDPRAPLTEPIELVQLGLGSEAELVEITRNLIGAATSLSKADRQDLKLLIDHFATRLEMILPAEIPHKENLAFVTSLLIDHAAGSDVLLTRYFTTATDVLRLAVALSDGDLSLAKPTKFAAIPRATRRLLVSLIDRLAAPDEDLWRHDGPWLRLAERLHPGELAKRYPKAAAAFARLRAGDRPNTFNRQVETALRERDARGAVARLRTRPGELARRLDHLLRLDPSSYIVEDFARVAGDVATPVLLQVLSHFEFRDRREVVRPIFPKGQTAKVFALPNTLPVLPADLCACVVAACEAALITRFRALPPLGRCWLDPALASYMVPFSQRSASKALRTIVRGSRLPMRRAPTLRFFLWWKEGKIGDEPTGRVDIDLSAVAYRADFTCIDMISWTSLRSGKFKGAHSGDITSAPAGACEFIDLDLASVKQAGGRYIVPVVFSFTGHRFCDLPECFLGWMGRRDPASGEIFEPATVSDRLDLGSDQRVAIPAIFDLETDEMIWVDAAYRAQPETSAMVETHTGSIESLLVAMTALHVTSLHRLFGLHIAARGTAVVDRRAAETVFSAEDSPFDVETIMAHYLA